MNSSGPKKQYYTMDDLDFYDRTVLLRVDVNSPLDPESEAILDDARFRSHARTISELKDAKVVILAHQSRPTKKDFTTLEAHGKKFQEILDRPVEYVEDVIGRYAREKIRGMRRGDIILLENVRILSEEVSKMKPEEMGRTLMVERLSGLSDFYINDAFATSHRAQPSIVGFPLVMPSCAGRLMEKELNGLGRVITENSHPVTFVFGGSKVDDTIKVIKNVLKRGKVDKILLTGLVANVFLAADGVDIGKKNLGFVEREGYVKQIEEAKRILKGSKDKIVLPKDLAIKKEGERIDVNVKDFPVEYPICDIGIETLVKFSNVVENAKAVVINGPAGIFEEEEFSLGTCEILKASTRSKCALIGGGHTASVARRLQLEGKVRHISTGGGASIAFLAGEELPGVEALKRSKEKFKNRLDGSVGKSG